MREFLAGMAGFGPANDGVKVRCLTPWLHPKISVIYKKRKTFLLCAFAVIIIQLFSVIVNSLYAKYASSVRKLCKKCGISAIKLRIIKLCIEAVFLQKLLVTALFYNIAVL